MLRVRPVNAHRAIPTQEFKHGDIRGSRSTCWWRAPPVVQRTPCTRDVRLSHRACAQVKPTPAIGSLDVLLLDADNRSQPSREGFALSSRQGPTHGHRQCKGRPPRRVGTGIPTQKTYSNSLIYADPQAGVHLGIADVLAKIYQVLHRLRREKAR